MSKKQKNGSNQELVEQQIAERNKKLEECASRVIKLQSEIEASDTLSIQHGKRTLEIVIQAGTILIEAQGLVKSQDVHWLKKGLWAKWVSENVKGITLRTVQNYMKLAFEAKRGDEIKDYLRKTGQPTKHVSLLDEAKSLREAYRAVGIIKKKPGANEDGDGDPRMETPDQLKRRDKTQYEDRVKKAVFAMRKLVPEMIREEKEAIFNTSQWTINEGKLRPGNNETGRLFDALIQYVADHDRSLGLTRDDEVYNRAGVVLSEVLKTILLANQPSTQNGLKSINGSNFSVDLNPVKPPKAQPERFRNNFDGIFRRDRTPIQVTQE